VDKALDYRPKGNEFDPCLDHKRRSTWATSFSMWYNTDLLIIDHCWESIPRSCWPCNATHWLKLVVWPALTELQGGGTLGKGHVMHGIHGHVTALPPHSINVNHSMNRLQNQQALVHYILCQKSQTCKHLCMESTSLWQLYLSIRSTSIIPWTDRISKLYKCALFLPKVTSVQAFNSFRTSTKPRSL
jgi:hypothetical protein